MRTEQPCIVLNFFRKGFENDVQDQRREEKFKTLSLSVLQESATLCSVRGLLMQLLSVGHHTKSISSQGRTAEWQNSYPDIFGVQLQFSAQKTT